MDQREWQRFDEWIERTETRRIAGTTGDPAPQRPLGGIRTDREK